jgi:hypothetical protein
MISEVSNALGVPPALLVLSVAFLAILYLVSGIGMWRGTRWGWWLGAFSYSYAVARAASGLLFVSGFSGGLEGLTDADYRKLGIKFSGRIVVSSLLFLYFFKSTVLAFFGLETLSKAKATAALIGTTLAVACLAVATQWLAK